MDWADGFMVVYNISDRASFINAKNLLRQIREARLEHCKGSAAGSYSRRSVCAAAATFVSHEWDVERCAEVEQLWQIFSSGFASSPCGARWYNKFWLNLYDVKNAF